MNPIVITELINLIVEHDKQLVFEHAVDVVSLLSTICMYFIGSYDLKAKFIEQLLKIIELVRVEYLKQRQSSQPGEVKVKITKEIIEDLISLKIFNSYFSEFESYH